MPISEESQIPKVLIVVPCLNEEAYIGALLRRLSPVTDRLDARIVVADGGSSDGTLRIARRFALDDPRILVVQNPRRIQAAAVNLAVERYGDGADYLIRIDAHGSYPDDYCDQLVEEAIRTGADAVVVSMETTGRGPMQSAAAAVQSSRLGTGGSRHRHASGSRWIDHGHHALMRISAFRAVGGYDETFTHNEDAELDYRLNRAGYRIWLTGKTHMIYYPRSSLVRLYLQFLAYGRGRARNVLKHRIVPKLRQIVPMLVVPAVAIAPFGLVEPILAAPLAIWLSVCAGFGLRTAWRQGQPQLVLAGLSMMVMHFGWSLGFWMQLLFGAGFRGEAAR